jgi:hypothetical protein
MFDEPKRQTKPESNDNDVMDILASIFPPKERKISQILVKQPDCHICLKAFQNSDEVRLLPGCQHLFHSACIDPWLIEVKGSCAVCRSNVKEKLLKESFPI